MTGFGRWFVALVPAAAIACSDANGPSTVALTSQQADVIVQRAGQIAIGHPELSWLADSLELVVHSGAQVKQIVIVIDGSPKTYFAVSLTRAIVIGGSSPSSFSTFHLLAFDALADPTKFVVVNGFKSVTGTTPPTNVTGSFSGAAAAGHILEVGTTAVVEWIAATGTATFTAGAQGAPCEAFTPANGVTCFASSLTASFEITASQAPSPLVAMKTASMASVDVPGVLLHIVSTF